MCVWFTYLLTWRVAEYEVARPAYVCIGTSWSLCEIRGVNVCVYVGVSG